MKHLFIDARSIYSEMDGLSFFSVYLIERIYKRFLNKLRISVCLPPSFKDNCNINHQHWIKNLDLLFWLKERFGDYEFDIIEWNKFISLQKPDIYLSTAFFQTDYDCIKATVIHDLIPLVSPKLDPKKRSFYSKVIEHSILNSHLIITPSYYTKKDIKHNFNKIPPIIILYPDIEAIISRVRNESKAFDSYDIGDTNYFVMLGIKCPRKNVEVVIEALKIIKNKRTVNCRIVFVGKARNNDVPIEKMVKKYGLDKLCYLKGYIHDSELIKLIRNSKGLIFPSVYEGFGMPIIEFFACGKPVICLKQTSIPEVASDLALYIENSPEHLAEAIESAISFEPTDSWKLRVERHLEYMISENKDQYNRLFSWIERNNLE